MQDNLICFPKFPKLPLRLLRTLLPSLNVLSSPGQSSQQGTGVQMRAGVVRLAGAGVLALVMATLFSTNAFAREATYTTAAWPMMANPQQTSAPVEANSGLVIVAVDQAGPAAKAGIVRGDILQMVGNAPVDSVATLYAVVTAGKVGDAVEVAVQHGDETRTLAVTLGQMGDRPYLGVQVVDSPTVDVTQAGQTKEAATEVAAPTMAPQMVTPQIVTATVVASGEAASMAPGLIVADVMAAGPAANAGLVAGDLLLAIDGQPVASLDDVLNALKGHTPGEVAIVRVQKGGPIAATIADLPVTLGAAPDDPARAYLGLNLVAMPASVTIEALPSVETFTAPAMPGIPAMPGMPDVVYSYGYGGYAAPTMGEACGTTIQQYFYAPAIGSATFSMPAAPVLPPMPAMPPMPAAPYFIYQSGVNQEINPYDVAGKAQGNMIWYNAAPVSGYAAPVMQPYPGTTVEVTTSEMPFEKRIAIMRSQTIPGILEGKEVMTVDGYSETVSANVVQVAPTARKFEIIGANQTTEVAVPQAVPQVVPVPATTDGWY